MATAELLIQAATRNAVMLERLKSGEVEKIDPFSGASTRIYATG